MTATPSSAISVITRFPGAVHECKNRLIGTCAEPNRSKVASVTWDQVRKIAEDKMQDLNAFTVESAMKMVAGTARSMGINVKGGKAPE